MLAFGTSNYVFSMCDLQLEGTYRGLGRIALQLRNSLCRGLAQNKTGDPLPHWALWRALYAAYICCMHVLAGLHTACACFVPALAARMHTAYVYTVY